MPMTALKDADEPLGGKALATDMAQKWRLQEPSFVVRCSMADVEAALLGNCVFK